MKHDTGTYFVPVEQLALEVAGTLRRFDELRAGRRDHVVDSTGLTDSDADDGNVATKVTLEELDDYEASYRNRWAGTVALIEGDQQEAGRL